MKTYVVRTWQKANPILAEKPRLLVLEPFRSSDAILRLGEKFDVWSLRDIADIPTLPTDFTGLVTRLKYRIDGDFVARFPHLQFVATPTTGLVHIDLDAMVRHGIKVISLKQDVEFLRNLTATAELVWGLILTAYRNLGPATESVRAGLWDREPYIGYELREKTLGIVGLGRLGSMVAEVGAAFRMKVLYCDTELKDTRYAQRVPFDTLLADSDIITLHVHVTPQTTRMLGAREFALMQRKPIIVNTARGEVIDEEALLAALSSGQIGGACLDVLWEEHWNTEEEKVIWTEKNRLMTYARKHRNLILTPHIGGLVFEGAIRAEEHLLSKILA